MKHFVSIALTLGIISFVEAQTTILPGEVYGTWTQSRSPYQITGAIHIPHDSTLIIEAGVKVEFQGNFELKVMGNLLAEGTLADTILFTVNDTTGYFLEDTTLGGWKGIRIYDIDVSNDSTKLAYCRLEYGKAIGSGWNHNAGGALYVFQFDKVSVSHCLFDHNKACTYDEVVSSGGAICFEYADISFRENTFTRNKAYRGGAIYFHSSDPVFRNNKFVYNQCGWEGGGISGGGGSNPSFSEDLFYKNHSGEMGGGCMIYGPGKLSLNQVTVEENSANWAGGLGFVGCDVHILNSSISHNLAFTMGGGIASDASTLTIENSVFEGDSSSNIAGAIHAWQDTLRLQNVILKNNSARAGGGINADWSHVFLEQSRLQANSAERGGGLVAFNCNLTLDSCLLDGNKALEFSGALDYAVDTLVFDSLFNCTLSKCQILNNYSANAAGGMTILQTHSDFPMLNLRIDQCLIADNHAHHVGGFRIMGCVEPLQLSNSIIRGNTVEAWTAGGSIARQSFGQVFNCLFYDNHSATVNSGATTGGLGISSLGTQVDVNHCTFANNSAGRGAGLQVYRGGDAIVSNSIFWENYPEQLALSSVFDSLPCKLTLNYNNIQHGRDSINTTDTVSVVIFGEGNRDEDPLFADTAQADYRLMETSPAIGAAMDKIQVEGRWYYSPDLDLEGNPRPNPSGSRPDLGAYESARAWPVGLDDHLQDDPVRNMVIVYPNPFTNGTTFHINLTEESLVTLEIFNLLGECLEVIPYRNLGPGIKSLRWHPAQADHVIYYYRIRIESVSNRVGIKTGKILKMD